MTPRIPSRCKCRLSFKYFAAPNAAKKRKKRGRSKKFEISPPTKPASEEKVEVIPDVPPLADDNIEDDNSEMSASDKSESQNTILLPSRGAVLQACTITSCLMEEWVLLSGRFLTLHSQRDGQ